MPGTTKTVKVGYFELTGTHYDVGQQLGEILGTKKMLLNKRARFTKVDVAAAMHLYETYCPGICDELHGYADAVGAPVERLLYVFMTYLRPRCSQMALLPPLVANGHTVLARSYEFTPRLEDFHLFRTAVDGKYIHLGGSVAEFGRSEGLNECGLGVSMTSCGLPMSNLKAMRAPAIHGLHFWAVVRTILETCKDVAAAVDYARKVPIAYNINLLLTDTGGHAALVETLDGRFAVRGIGPDSEAQYLHSTNHAHIDEMIAREPLAMHNSRVRYERIRRFLTVKKPRTEQDVKSLLLTAYPKGLYCPYYHEFFGTIKSVIMDLTESRFTICWGGLAENGWQDYALNQTVGPQKATIQLQDVLAPPYFFVQE